MNESGQSSHTSPALVLTASPRLNGNSDTAAHLFAQAATAANSRAPVVCHVRDVHVSPCVACGSCDAAAASLAGGDLRPLPLPFGCPLTRKDESAALLRMIATAQDLCIVSPIYFYHLPADLKGLLDRMQCFFALQEACRRAGRSMPDLLHHFCGETRESCPDAMSRTTMPLRQRNCRVILLGARQTGEKLFAGSLLTLKYALAPLGIALTEPLLLYGLDAVDDLRRHTEHQKAIMAYGTAAGAEALSVIMSQGI